MKQIAYAPENSFGDKSIYVNGAKWGEIRVFDGYPKIWRVKRYLGVELVNQEVYDLDFFKLKDAKNFVRNWNNSGLEAAMDEAGF